jgi:hypothetical protein
MAEKEEIHVTNSGGHPYYSYYRPYYRPGLSFWFGF